MQICHHSELNTIKAINNLKALTGGEEREGGNFRYSDWSLPSTPPPPAEAKKKSHYQQDMLPEFSASTLPLLTKPIWGATSIHTKTFSIESQNADVTARYANSTRTSAEPNLQSLARLRRKKPPNPKATSPRALGNKPSLFAPHILLQPPLGSRATELSPRHPPRGWEPASPAALGKFPGKLSRRAAGSPGARLCLPWGEGRQAGCLPRSASAGVRGAQRWRAGNSSVIISAERLLLWTVYIL